ncbi:hypothetical protein P22_0914 [Propionispora sp. 2/2-37]|uniref:phosphate/phosphite/phosphonate ABC transporter substrate-binding protein n=1 Tax=Propionispora sp. 2/2-37 TaxID=1677858 RepID=UPI0006BB6345|nr:phosphate/phosphite/phosphonate ABC transporter substrate-binding protein [Propionispora sp. 2/2-37]CUH94848.1 hypothetical protein P22_0914 [Propionispora sp. 2/2-37]
MNGNAAYTGYIIARSDSGFQSLEDLRGKRFAFVDRQSASGYIYPRAILLHGGKDPEHFFGETAFLGNHNRVIEAVADGSVDAGGTYSEALEDAKSRGLPIEKLKILAQSEHIPKDVIAACSDLDPCLAENIKRVFMEITTADRKLYPVMRKTGLTGFIEAQDEAYHVIRRVANIVKTGVVNTRSKAVSP